MTRMRASSIAATSSCHPRNDCGACSAAAISPRIGSEPVSMRSVQVTERASMLRRLADPHEGSHQAMTPVFLLALVCPRMA
jgi:hypothetical protein